MSKWTLEPPGKTFTAVAVSVTYGTQSIPRPWPEVEPDSRANVWGHKFIECDACGTVWGCDAPTQDDSVWHGAVNDGLREEGWVLGDDSDLCPNCTGDTTPRETPPGPRLVWQHGPDGGLTGAMSYE